MSKFLQKAFLAFVLFFVAADLMAQESLLSCNAKAEGLKINLDVWEEVIELELQDEKATKSCQLKPEKFFRTGRFDEVYKVGFNGNACRQKFADVFDIKVIKKGYIAVTKNEKDTTSVPSASMNLLNIGDTIPCQRVEVKTSFFNLF